MYRQTRLGQLSQGAIGAVFLVDLGGFSWWILVDDRVGCFNFGEVHQPSTGLAWEDPSCGLMAAGD